MNNSRFIETAGVAGMFGATLWVVALAIEYAFDLFEPQEGALYAANQVVFLVGMLCFLTIIAGLIRAGAGGGRFGRISLDLSSTHRTWLSGRDTGHMPFRIEGTASRLLFAPLVLRLVFHRVLTVNTPIGRRARPKILSRGAPVIRVKPDDLSASGVERVPRMIGVRDGLPLLEEDRTLDAANVIWCTGFHPGFSWIDLPVFGKEGPVHERGVVESEPGLYFVGLEFLYAMSSVMVHGVGRDAEHIANHIASRVPVG